MASRQIMAERAPGARAIRLPSLQHAALHAMGVQVPWIVAETSSVPARAHVVDPLMTSSVPGQGSLQDTPEGSGTGISADATITQAYQRKADPRTLEGSTSDIATLDFDALSRRIQSCQACALCGKRQHAVVGQGVLHSMEQATGADEASGPDSSMRTSKPVLMVIGEAPGEQEDLQGQPFVGPSGELLDNMLAAIGCNRSDNVYITNAVKCRPPANRSPREDEMAACLPYLKRQIELVAPSVILALGRFASQTLLGSDVSLMSLREQNHQFRMGHTQVPLVVTYHPAYLLRKPVDKRLAWQDLKRVAALLRR